MANEKKIMDGITVTMPKQEIAKEPTVQVYIPLIEDTDGAVDILLAIRAGRYATLACKGVNINLIRASVSRDLAHLINQHNRRHTFR